MVAKARDVRSMERKSDPRGDFATRAETVVKESAARMFERLKMMRKVLGKRPYQGLPVKPEQIAARVMQIRHDTNALMQVIGENVRIKPDGRVLISKEFMSIMTETEAKLRKGGIK